MTKTTSEEMSSEIADELIIAYQNASLLGLFHGVDLIDIGIENWFHKNLDDIPDAALTLAGFNPSVAKLNAGLHSHQVLTSAEKLVITQKEWAQFTRYGLTTEGIAMIGKKVGQLATYYLFRGEDKNGVSPSGDANYITAAGAGTLESPSIITSALTGVWGTYANKINDCNKILGDLRNAGHNIFSTVIYYPIAAYASMRYKAADEMSAIELLEAQGIMAVIDIDNEYLYTAAGALPTDALFDLYAVDHAMVDIGYTMSETSNVIAPHDEVRDTVAEAEVWFVPYMRPMPKDGAITKGVSRITAIAQA